MELTRADILKDVDSYRTRLERAQASLAALPARGSKLKLKRQQLQAEAKHVAILMGYAREALQGLEAGSITN